MAGLRDHEDERRPTANPHMHSNWNSKHPKSSSMEFHRARGRQINHRQFEAERVGWGVGGW